MIPFQLHRKIPLIRRPFYQRDVAIRERDEIAASLKQVEKELFRTASERNYLQGQLAESATRQWSACPVQYGIDRYWCDNNGIYLEGWISPGSSRVSSLQLEAGESAVAISNFVDGHKFEAYLPRNPSHTIFVTIAVSDQRWRSPIVLPPGSLSSGSWSHERPPALQQGLFASQQLAFNTMVEYGNSEGRLVCEVGSRNVAPESAPKRGLFPRAERYVGVDIHGAANVDIVGDAHFLHEMLGEASADVVFSGAVLEHLSCPWLFSAAVNRTLKPGGLTFHATHQAWPVHEAPNDFWRFSDEALKILFGPETGFRTLSSGMHNPSFMYPEERSGEFARLPFFACYSHVFILAEKVRDLDELSVKWPMSSRISRSRSSRYPARGP
jgi:SAM-dependent methyltransferase